MPSLSIETNSQTFPGKVDSLGSSKLGLISCKLQFLKTHTLTHPLLPNTRTVWFHCNGTFFKVLACVLHITCYKTGIWGSWHRSSFSTRLDSWPEIYLGPVPAVLGASSLTKGKFSDIEETRRTWSPRSLSATNFLPACVPLPALGKGQVTK